MSTTAATAHVRLLPASGVGGGLREVVARRHGRRRNPARTSPRSSLRTTTNPPPGPAQRWLRKVGRSDANSETPHANRSDATLVHTPIASMASATSRPCPAGGSSEPSSARAPAGSDRRSTPPTTGTAAANHAPSHQAPRAAHPPAGTPRGPPRTAPRRSPPPHSAGARGTPPAAAHASPGTTDHDNDRDAAATAGPPNRSGPLASASSPSLPTRLPDNAGRPTGRQRDPPRPRHDRLRRSARRPPTASRAPSSHPVKVSAREPSINRITTILSTATSPTPAHHHPA